MALDELAQKYGSPMTFYLGAVRAIHINDAKNVKQIISTQGKDFLGRLEPLIFNNGRVGEGIILASGEPWKTGRRTVLQAMRDFGMGKEKMIDKIDEEIHHLIADMDSACGKTIELKEMLTAAVSNIIALHVFGKRFEKDDPFFVKMVGFMKEFAELPQMYNVPYMCFPFLTKISRPEFVRLTIDSREHFVNYWRNTSLKEHMEDFNPENIRDFCDLFLLQRQKYGVNSIDELSFSAIMGDLFGAGTETSTTTLNWLILMISKYPEIQRKCQLEIDKIIESDRLAKSSDSPKLVYVNAVINETARFGSIAPLSLFHSNLEKQTKIGDFDVPPFTMIMYNIYSLHHNKDYWKDPEVFRPERWIDDNGNLLSHSEYFMPFGIGPRICVGELLAKAEIFHFTVALLHRFDFKLETPNIDFENNECGVINHAPTFAVSIKRR